VVSISGEIVCSPFTVVREMGSPPVRDYGENMQVIVAFGIWNGAPAAPLMFSRAGVCYRPRNDQADRTEDSGFLVRIVPS
jgi:hypothetical protein